MKKTTYHILSAGAALLLAACAAETPFSSEVNPGEGRFLTDALNLSLDERVQEVRSAETPSVNDFTVAFYRGDKKEQEFRYGAMPEVVTLPAGDYTVTASHGDNPVADFEAPYFAGSAQFTVEENKITDTVDPIVCRLSNVKVTVVFESDLLKEMDADCKVTVKMGENGSLDFTPADNQSGYFRYVEGSSTLVALFKGTVEGEATEISRNYDKVEPGNHYRLTYRLNQTGGEDPGYIDPGEEGKEINIEAKLEIIGLDPDDTNGTNVDFNEEIRDDKERPSTGDDNREDPTPDDNPPVIQGLNGLVLLEGDVRTGGETNYTDELPEETVKDEEGDDVVQKICTIRITSTAEGGIQEFTAEIVSEKLTPYELSQVGLCNMLDLVHPDQSRYVDETDGTDETRDVTDALNGLGLACNTGGMKSVDFKIGGFAPLLGTLGACDHYFVLRVKDANGESVHTLKLTVR